MIDGKYGIDRTSYNYHRDIGRAKAFKRVRVRVNMIPLMDPDTDPEDRLKAALVSRMILDAALWRRYNKMAKVPAPVLSGLATGRIDELADGLHKDAVCFLLEYYGIKMSARAVCRCSLVDYAAA